MRNTLLYLGGKGQAMPALRFTLNLMYTIEAAK
jgi:hypothetical protein